MFTALKKSKLALGLSFALLLSGISTHAYPQVSKWERLQETILTSRITFAALCFVIGGAFQKSVDMKAWPYQQREGDPNKKGYMWSTMSSAEAPTQGKLNVRCDTCKSYSASLEGTALQCAVNETIIHSKGKIIQPEQFDTSLTADLHTMFAHAAKSKGGNPVCLAPQRD